MDSYGFNPSPKIPRIEEAEKFLISCYIEEWPELILKAAFDNTKRHNLRFTLNWPEMKHTSKWGGTVNYCKKTRRFDFIEYSSLGYAKRIDISEITPTPWKDQF